MEGISRIIAKGACRCGIVCLTALCCNIGVDGDDKGDKDGKKVDTFVAIDFPSTSGDVVLTAPQSISSSGKIVGYFLDSSGVHGFLLRKGNYSEIDVKDAFLTEAVGINADNAISGFYRDVDGFDHGFLLRPGSGYGEVSALNPVRTSP